VKESEINPSQKGKAGCKDLKFIYLQLLLGANAFMKCNSEIGATTNSTVNDSFNKMMEG
jgi:hypothetical protein